MLHIFVDADACPVKQEVYRVAKRCRLKVTLVANSWMRIPHEPSIQLEVVSGAQDAAALPDLADDEYQRFICIEPALIQPDTLAAGAQWTGRQHLEFI